MDDRLPTDVAKLQALLLQSREAVRQSREEVRQRDLALQVAEHRTAELCTTIEEQRGKLETAQQQIVELLRALRGKQRERLDPDQLLLFEVGELETFLEEPEGTKPTSARNRKRKRGRRLIPEDAPHEERIYELPEEERLCPHDGPVMPRIRWEESKQLDRVRSTPNQSHRTQASGLRLPGETRRSHVGDSSETTSADRERIGWAGAVGSDGGRQIWRSSSRLSGGRYSIAARRRDSSQHDLRLVGFDGGVGHTISRVDEATCASVECNPHRRHASEAHRQVTSLYAVGSVLGLPR